ncbi:nodulation protein NfeD, partial [Acidobacteriota bacterium]
TSSTEEKTAPRTETRARDVLHVFINDAIHPVSARLIGRAIDEADAVGAEMLIIQIQTPGGLMTSMDEIIARVLSAKTPIVIWVAPAGARCASAGFFILLSSDIAVMAPGTHTGAAHPVSGAGGGGNEDETMMRKVTHDAAANIRSIAEKRGRNIKLAEQAVRESHSYTENEALEGGLIEFIFEDMDAILTGLNGKTFKKFDGTEFTLYTEGAHIRTLEMTTKEKILSVITNPTVAYLLLLAGLLGLYVEITHPGAIFPGVMGGLSLLLALYALNFLPVNYVGILLILAALAMFIAEVKVTSYGLLTVGGIIAMIFGSLMLIDSPIEELRVPLRVIIPVVIAVAAIVTFLVGLVIAGSRRQTTTGAEGLVDKECSADTDIDPEGRVFVHGEYWNARSDLAIQKGQKVRIVSVEDDLTLKVESI